MSGFFQKFSYGIRIGAAADLTELGSLTNVQEGSLIWVSSEALFYQYDGASWAQISGATSTDFADNTFRISDNGDSTKKIAFQASGIGSGAVRTITMPDADVNLGALTNSNISSSAAIARSKIAAGSANQVVINDGSGNLSSEATLATSRGGLGTDASAFDGVVKASGGSFSASSIVNADVDAAAAIAYSKLDLSASIVNADINAAAAIAYSKLNLSSSITNTDIDASAAIDATKIANGMVSNSEFQYLTGVTSSIQTQISNKVEKTGDTMSGNLDMSSNKVTSLAAADTNGDAVRYEQAVLTDGSHAITGDQSFSSTAKITNLVDPISAQDAATKAYVDAAIAGLSWKQAAHVASVADVDVSSAPAAIDGHTLNSGERILLKDQTAPEENGLYVFNGTGNALTRSSDANTWNEIVGFVVYIEQGTVNAGSKWVDTNVAGGTLGTTAITITIFSAAGAIDGTGTNGYNAYWTSATTLAAEQYVAAARGGLGINASSLTGLLKFSGGAASASALVNADVDAAAAIAYSKLNLSASIVNADINASAAIAYSKLNLSTSIVNADINASAAIAYSKLNLSTSIVNADINASAAIDYSKLAALTASKVLVSDGSGVVSASAVTTTTLGYLDATSSVQTQLNAKVDKNSAGDQSIQANSGSNAMSLQSSVVRRAKATSTDFVEQEYVHSTTLSASQTGTAIGGSFSCAVATYESVEIVYHMKQATTNRVRTGKLSVDCDGTNVTYVDGFNETADVGITFSADISGGNLRILYDSGANAVTMRADIRRFKTI